MQTGSKIKSLMDRPRDGLNFYNDIVINNNNIIDMN